MKIKCSKCNEEYDVLMDICPFCKFPNDYKTGNRGCCIFFLILIVIAIFSPPIAFLILFISSIFCNFLYFNDRKACKKIINKAQDIISEAQNKADLLITEAKKFQMENSPDGVLTQAKTEAETILQGALVEKNQILDSAELQAKKLIMDAEEILSDAKIQKEKSEIIVQARIEAQSIISASKKEKSDCELLIHKLETKIAQLKSDNILLEKLHSELVEKYEFDNLNLYSSHYSFSTSIEFERELDAIQRAQKELIMNSRALFFVDEKSSKYIGKIALKAFNCESELLMSKVDYKNIVTYEKRINNTFDVLNKNIKKFGAEITKEYKDLKINELRIVFELQKKLHDEREEQRIIKEAMREEIKAEREMERAITEAKKQEEQYQNLLDKALSAAQSMHGDELIKMNAQIEVLKNQLAEAKEKERAISQAQLTKSGYVYVISNIGSFGENIYKIGMTRRLEPQERINELGDASVPFPFDVHAIIYSENAPELETQLHKNFDSKRVNKMNPRKEFFNVSLEEIEVVAKKINPKSVFTKTAEAEEYRQSAAIGFK